MYSPGKYYLKVPRERTENVRFRLYVMRRCREDRRFRKAVLHMCKEDILFFINVCIWQFNPNAIGKWSTHVGPFITDPYQDDAIRVILDCIKSREDCVMEKSREMGASWLCLIIMLWFFLFHHDTKFLCISRNSDAVDKPDDSDCLFWKIDYMLKKLPEWMTPSYTRRALGFSNHDNGSSITGQATTKKAGVGGRATAIFVDEYSQIKDDWSILERTANTSACRIFSGTHLGTNTAFYELCTKQAAGGHIRKIVMHWSAHPDKRRGLYHYDPVTQKTVYHDADYRYDAKFAPVTDGSPTGGPYPGLRSPWYDKKVPALGTMRAVAADLDINPSGSTEQVFDPLLIQHLKAHYCRQPLPHDFNFDKELATPRRFFESRTGKFNLWIKLTAEGLVPPGEYVAGADVATGTGATPTCLSVGNARTGEKVLEFTDSRIEPKEFAYLMVAVARIFKNSEGRGAKLAWEVPGPGNTVTKHVLALGYQPIYFRRTEHRMKTQTSDIPGWPNSPDGLRNLIENYRDALKGKNFLNRSEYALSECQAFVYEPDGYVYHTGWKDPKDPSAARINHGDRVVADALCWKLMDEWGKLSAGMTQEDLAAAAGDARLNPHMPPFQYDPRGRQGRFNLANSGGGGDVF